jgi:hypothetical protein
MPLPICSTTIVGPQHGGRFFLQMGLEPQESEVKLGRY